MKIEIINIFPSKLSEFINKKGVVACTSAGEKGVTLPKILDVVGLAIIDDSKQSGIDLP
jgi:hypothetical protein